MIHKKSTIQVYETKDYDCFRRLKGNRTATTFSKILNSIDKVGYIPNPIIVNEKMEIIDGQNRFLALKERGLPIPYILVEGIGNEECIAMNVGQKNWSTEDYVEHYAELGNKNYINLKHLLDKYKKVIKTIGVFVMCFGSGRGWTKRVKEGKLVLSDYRAKKCDDRIIWMIDNGIVNIYKERQLPAPGFFGAVRYWLIHPKANEKRLANRLSENVTKIGRYTTPIDYLKEFEYYYNKRLGSASKVYPSTDYERNLYKGGEWS